MQRLVAILLTALVLIPAAVQAQQGGGPGHRRERFMDRLGLSDEQRNKVRDLRIENQKAQTETFAKIRVARLEIRQLFLADKLDRGAIEKKIGVISDLQHQAKLRLLNHLFAVYDILTPEQQKLWKNHPEGFGPGFGRRHGPGGGFGMLDDHAPGDGQEQE